MANTKNSIYLSDDLQEFLDVECEKFGLGKSAFVSMVLAMYRHQVQSVSQIAKFEEYVQRLEKIVVSKS